MRAGLACCFEGLWDEKWLDGRRVTEKICDLIHNFHVRIYTIAYFMQSHVPGDFAELRMFSSVPYDGLLSFGGLDIDLGLTFSTLTGFCT